MWKQHIRYFLGPLGEEEGFVASSENAQEVTGQISAGKHSFVLPWTLP